MAPPIEPDPFDVVIAGAGLAGASLALGLARAGANVALLDPGQFPREKLCGEFLSPEAWGVLERLGVAEDVARSDYHPIRRVRLTTPRGTILEATVIGPDGRPGIGLGRATLDALLVSRAAQAGASIFERTRVGRPLIHEGYVVGVEARNDHSGPTQFRAAVTVAADGRHSGLVRRTGTTRRTTRVGPGYFGLKRHVFVNDPAAGEPDGTVGLHAVAGGYVGTCRVDGMRTNLCGLLPTTALRPHRGDLDRLAATEFHRNPALARLWSASTPAEPWKTVAGVEVVSARPRLAAVFYAGDARGTVDPLGGQGMTMALLGAEVLTPFILAALQDASSITALNDAYTSAWRRRFTRRIRLCRLFHHVLTHPGLLDLAPALGPLASQILGACYHATRDPGITRHASRSLSPARQGSA